RPGRGPDPPRPALRAGRAAVGQPGLRPAPAQRRRGQAKAGRAGGRRLAGPVRTEVLTGPARPTGLRYSPGPGRAELTGAAYWAPAQGPTPTTWRPACSSRPRSWAATRSPTG